jgi:hypothetical protein
MILEINDDFTDMLVQQVLLNDYVDLSNNLKKPKDMHEDDVIMYTETVKALKVLGNWYFAHGEFEKAVKKARKAK